MSRSIRSLRRHARGVTLIEVMLVVTVIGLIASMAIPNFMGFVVRAKTSERNIAFSNIAHVVLEEVGKDPQFSMATAVNPPAPYTGFQKNWGAPAGDWKKLAWAPDGRVRFHYQVTLAPGSGVLLIEGFSDLDGDNVPSHFLQQWVLDPASNEWVPLDIVNLGPGLN